MSRWMIAVVVVVVVVMAVAWMQATRVRFVQTATVRQGEIRTYVEERAKTKLEHVYRITMPLPGRIEAIDLVEGSTVQVGQVVAQMELSDVDAAIAQASARVAGLAARIVVNDDTRLEDSALEEILATLESVDRSVEAAEEETKASQARMAFSERQLQRTRAAAEGSATTASELDEAELTEIESRVDYRKDILSWRGLQAIRAAVGVWPRTITEYVEKKSLERAVLEQQQAEAQAELDRLLRDRARGTLRSPVDGVVTERHVSNERVLPVGAALLEIGRLEDLQVEVEVLTQDAANISVGDRVDIFGPAIGVNPVGGEVIRIDPQGFTKISSLGVEQQRVRVTVAFGDGVLTDLEEHGRTLGADYRVRVRVYTDRVEDAVIVPRASLFRSGDGAWRAFVMRSGRAQLVNVRVGVSNDASFQITEGLTAGDIILVAPESSIEDGSRVKLRE
ncbi:MAG: HlyD family efflux transporter periplasmic adaptor subunit [Phycisphaerales bacterium]|nr:HlyD family efflux transporter periplasmic adaptor subunit [Phycisphaerales bacterium]